MVLTTFLAELAAFTYSIFLTFPMDLSGLRMRGIRYDAPFTRITPIFRLHIYHFPYQLSGNIVVTL